MTKKEKFITKFVIVRTLKNILTISIIFIVPMIIYYLANYLGYPLTAEESLLLGSFSIIFFIFSCMGLISIYVEAQEKYKEETY